MKEKTTDPNIETLLSRVLLLSQVSHDISRIASV
jgi:hypothetical protein